MKFTLILSLAASAMALSVGTPVKRDGASVSSAIAAISSAVTALDAQASAFAGPNDAASLQGASDNVISAINAGTQAADASAPLTDTEALGLVTPIQSLSALVNKTVTNVINKKPTFDNVGVSSVVLIALQNQLTAANSFKTAVVSKLSTGLQATGNSLAQPIIDSLNNGITAFQAPPSGGSGSGSTTTTTGAATTTAAVPTTTAAVPTTTAAVPTTTAAVPTTTAAVPTTTAAVPTTTAAVPTTTAAVPTTTAKPTTTAAVPTTTPVSNIPTTTPVSNIPTTTPKPATTTGGATTTPKPATTTPKPATTTPAGNNGGWGQWQEPKLPSFSLPTFSLPSFNLPGHGGKPFGGSWHAWQA